MQKEQINTATTDFEALRGELLYRARWRHADTGGSRRLQCLAKWAAMMRPITGDFFIYYFVVLFLKKKGNKKGKNNETQF